MPGDYASSSWHRMATWRRCCIDLGSLTRTIMDGSGRNPNLIFSFFSSSQSCPRKNVATSMYGIP
jgi:hypothetical protein